MNWGYARVSSASQSLEGQVQTLVDAGVSEARVVVEHASGATKRPKLSNLLMRLRSGDELVVTRLDRLGRNAADLHELLKICKTDGIRLRSLTEGLESDGPMGCFLAHVLIAVAQWERETIRERSRIGIAQARARGVHLGRPLRLTPVEEQTALAWREQGWTVPAIAKSLHCSTSTVNRALRRKRMMGVIS